MYMYDQKGRNQLAILAAEIKTHCKLLLVSSSFMYIVSSLTPTSMMSHFSHINVSHLGRKRHTCLRSKHILIRPCPWTFMYNIWWSFFVLYSSTFHWPYTLTSPHQLEDFQFPLLFQPVRSYISRVIGVVTSDKWWTLLGFCYQRGRTSLCAQSTCIIQSWSWPNLYLCSCQSTLRPTI